LSHLLGILAKALSDGGTVAFPIVLLGGFIAALNPCCLALYPAAAATCCGVRKPAEGRSVVNALAFVVGMAMAMSLIGLLAALAGRITASGGSVLRYAVAIVPLVMGMQLLGWVHLPLANFSMKSSGVKIASAFGCGFLLSLVIAPCGTPVLASVLSYAAFKGNPFYGALLLFVYGLGAGIPLLVAASVSSRFTQRLDLRGYRRWVDQGTGALLLALGFYLLWVA
jgi:cytochrome c-type biogenesis protein